MTTCNGCKFYEITMKAHLDKPAIGRCKWAPPGGFPPSFKYVTSNLLSLESTEEHNCLQKEDCQHPCHGVSDEVLLKIKAQVGGRDNFDDTTERLNRLGLVPEGWAVWEDLWGRRTKAGLVPEQAIFLGGYRVRSNDPNNFVYLVPKDLISKLPLL